MIRNSTSTPSSSYVDEDSSSTVREYTNASGFESDSPPRGPRSRSMVQAFAELGTRSPHRSSNYIFTLAEDQIREILGRLEAKDQYAYLQIIKDLDYPGFKEAALAAHLIIKVIPTVYTLSKFEATLGMRASSRGWMDNTIRLFSKIYHPIEEFSSYFLSPITCLPKEIWPEPLIALFNHAQLPEIGCVEKAIEAGIKVISQLSIELQLKPLMALSRLLEEENSNSIEGSVDIICNKIISLPLTDQYELFTALLENIPLRHAKMVIFDKIFSTFMESSNRKREDFFYKVINFIKIMQGEEMLPAFNKCVSSFFNIFSLNDESLQNRKQAFEEFSALILYLPDDQQHIAATQYRRLVESLPLAEQADILALLT